MPSPSVIVVLGTGGTISATAPAAEENVRYSVGRLDIDALAASVAVEARVVVETKQVAAIDSKDMDFATWRRLAEAVHAALARPEVRGVVVAHGTDTLEESAWLLQRVVAADRPVVLTGAMRPASSRQADGPQNLADAIVVASTVEASGVVVVLDGTIHSACDVRKCHPYRLDAFSSGDAGVLGRIEEGKVRPLRPWPRPQPLGLDVLPLDATAWPAVGLVASGAGADPRSVSALVEAGFSGLVVATTGNGTLHRDLEPALRQAVSRGVVVVRSTRCLDGVIVAAKPSIGTEPEVYEAVDLTPPKARVELILRLLAKARAQRRAEPASASANS